MHGYLDLHGVKVQKEILTNKKEDKQNDVHNDEKSKVCVMNQVIMIAMHMTGSNSSTTGNFGNINNIGNDSNHSNDVDDSNDRNHHNLSNLSSFNGLSSKTTNMTKELYYLNHRLKMKIKMKMKIRKMTKLTMKNT